MVSFNNFHQLDPAAHHIAMELLVNAGQHPGLFASFIFRWMAFNGWASAVTLESKDALMLSALVAHPRLKGSYDRLMADDADFAKLVTDFAALWPVLNVGGVRKHFGFNAFFQHDRNALIAMCQAAHVRVQPENWGPGALPSWSQLLWTIYQVRCNLFHGQKSPQSERDRDLVSASDRVLEHFIDATNCFQWNDIP